MTGRFSRVMGLVFLVGVGAAQASPALDGIDAASLRPDAPGSESFQPMAKVDRFASEASVIYSRNRERKDLLEHLFAKLKEQVAEDLKRHELGRARIERWNIPAPEEGRKDAPAPALVASAAGRDMIGKPAIAPATGTHHVVERGDTLRAIARKHYGDPGMYRLIVRANGLTAASTIYVGQSLVIPRGDADSQPGSSPRVVATAKKPQPRSVSGVVRPVSAPVRPRIVRPAIASKPRVVVRPPLDVHQAPKVHASVNQAKAAARSRKIPSQDSLDYGSYEFKLYTVKHGDSLTSIAERFYGDSQKYELIKSYNRIAAAQSLKSGDRVLIPLPKSQEAQRRYLLAKKGIFLDR